MHPTRFITIARHYVHASWKERRDLLLLDKRSPLIDRLWGGKHRRLRSRERERVDNVVAVKRECRARRDRRGHGDGSRYLGLGRRRRRSRRRRQRRRRRRRDCVNWLRAGTKRQCAHHLFEWRCGSRRVSTCGCVRRRGRGRRRRPLQNREEVLRRGVLCGQRRRGGLRGAASLALKGKVQTLAQLALAGRRLHTKARRVLGKHLLGCPHAGRGRARLLRGRRAKCCLVAHVKLFVTKHGLRAAVTSIGAGAGARTARSVHLRRAVGILGR